LNERLTRFCATLSLCVLLSPLQAQEAAKPDELVVIDLRPQIEKDGTGLSALTGKCNKDVFRIADVASDPLKVEALRADLAQQLGLAGDGKTLMVLNWSVYYNKYTAKGGPMLSGLGVQGYAIPRKEKEEKRGSKCARKESAGGWYEASEVTTSYPPIISEFSGTFGGKPFNVRIVHSLRHSIEGTFEGGTDDTQELLDTVQETAEALATAIVQ
jgi:hypothetical protein